MDEDNSVMTLAELLSGLAQDVHNDQDAHVDYWTLRDAILRACIRVFGLVRTLLALSGT